MCPREIEGFDVRVEKERAKASVRVEAAKERGAPEGNRNAAKGDGNKETNCHIEKRKGSQSHERIIARLKRDAETDTKAAALLGSIEAGDIGASFSAETLALGSGVV